MKYLLDTHIFLWSLGKSSVLPKRVKEEIKNPANEIYVSAVTLWEIVIKARIGKLTLGGIEIPDLLSLGQEIGFQFISLSPEDAISYAALSEVSHFDPFDRILIWQAIARRMTMISKDSAFQNFIPHGLRLFWK